MQKEIELPNVQGGTFRARVYSARGGLAVTSPDGPPAGRYRRYNVTHLPTGCAAAHAFSLRAAREAMAALLSLPVEWPTLPTPALVLAVCEPHREAIRLIRERARV